MNWGRDLRGFIIDEIGDYVELSGFCISNTSRAKKNSDLAMSAPALLEALESIVGDYETPENYDVKIIVSKRNMEKAKIAIKLARVE